MKAIGQTDKEGDLLLDFQGKVGLYKHESKGKGFGVYLYEDANWQLNDKWLLSAHPKGERKARELFERVVSIVGDA